MKISELKNCPLWLKKAKTKDADVRIINGIVHWYGGTWKSGTWEGSHWHNGTWKDGTWEGGHWHNGTWENGTWKNGTWYDGIWHNGTWKNGVWKIGYWHSGIWEKGYWHSGIWHKGTWNWGIWNGGVWYNGTWNSGTWEGGCWMDGTWNNGIWKDGIWYDGTWVNGEQGVRSPCLPRLVADNRIKIGFETKTREEWDEWFANPEEYFILHHYQKFKLIRASYKGFIAYAKALKLIPKKNENLRTKKLPRMAKKGKNKRR